MAMANEGVKHDEGKPRYDLYPPEAMDGTVRVLTFGAKKYGDRNWEKGLKYSRVFRALMGHLWAFWRMEENDAETGESHLHHAACCLAFLQTYHAQGRRELDDRSNHTFSRIAESVKKRTAATAAMKDKMAMQWNVDYIPPPKPQMGDRAHYWRTSESNTPLLATVVRGPDGIGNYVLTLYNDAGNTYGVQGVPWASGEDLRPPGHCFTLYP